jgi:hypothetical protein
MMLTSSVTVRVDVTSTKLEIAGMTAQVITAQLPGSLSKPASWRGWLPALQPAQPVLRAHAAPATIVIVIISLS